MVRTSLTDQVVDVVRERVRGGDLVPGPLYSVYRLADELGVSRSPVREALLRLAEAGLVSIERNRGFRVVLPDPHDLAEIMAVRTALEVPAAARFAARATAEDVAALERLRALMRAAVERDDEPGFVVADRALHDAVLRGAGNARAAAIVDALRETTRMLGASTARTRRTLEQIRAEHDPVVDAIVAADPDRAAAAMRAHLDRTARLLAGEAAWATLTDPHSPPPHPSPR